MQGKFKMMYAQSYPRLSSGQAAGSRLVRALIVR